MNIKKINIIVVLVLVIGVFYLGFTSAQEEELIDICAMEDPPLDCGDGLNIFGESFKLSEDGIFSFIGEGGKLVFNKGEENELVLEGNEGVEVSKEGEINFTKEEGEIIVNGKKFENIVPPGDYGSEFVSNAFVNIDTLTGEIKKCNFLVGEGGGNYEINGASFFSPENGLVNYDSSGDGVLELVSDVKGEKIKLGNITEAIKISGYDVEVSEGYVMEKGLLDFDGEGGVFVDDNALIDGVNVDSRSGEGSEVGLFFDEEGDSKNYVSFGKDKLSFGSEEYFGAPIISLSEDNPYMQMEEGDNVEFTLRDNLEAVLDKRGFGKSGNLEGSIPRLTIKNGEMDIEEDGKSIGVSTDYNAFSFSDIRIGDSTTSPLEIVLEGNEEQKLFVDNFNRFALVPKGVDEYFADSEGIDVKFSSRVRYNYFDEDDLEKITGVPVEFQGRVSKGKEQVVLGKFRDYWDELTPETKNSVNRLEIFDNIKEMQQACSGSESTGACADYDGNILFATDEFSFNYEIFRHEASHQRHYELIGRKEGIRNSEEYKELSDEWKSLFEKLNSNSINEEEKKILKKRMSEITSKQVELSINNVDSFTKKWKETSGEYNQVVKDGDYYSYEKPKSGFQSQYGYTTPYGGTKLREDVAEFVRFSDDPEFYKPLLSEENEWNEAYRKKLGLLYEYKFISEEEYNKILEEAGVK